MKCLIKPGSNLLPWDGDVSRSSIILSNNEGTVTHVAAVSRKITERERAEEALRESEERFRNISELTSDFVYSFRFEPDGKPLRDVGEWVTEAFTRITGFTPHEVDERGGWRSLGAGGGLKDSVW